MSIQTITSALNEIGHSVDKPIANSNLRADLIDQLIRAGKAIDEITTHSAIRDVQKKAADSCFEAVKALRNDVSNEMYYVRAAYRDSIQFVRAVQRTKDPKKPGLLRRVWRQIWKPAAYVATAASLAGGMSAGNGIHQYEPPHAAVIESKATVSAQPAPDAPPVVAEKVLVDSTPYAGLDSTQEGKLRFTQRNLDELRRQGIDVVGIAIEAGQKTGEDPAVLLAHITQESEGLNNRVSKSGARGLCGIMPTSIPDVLGPGGNPNNPYEAIHGMARYRQKIRRRLPESADRDKIVTAAYNGGPTISVALAQSVERSAGFVDWSLFVQAVWDYKNNHSLTIQGDDGAQHTYRFALSQGKRREMVEYTPNVYAFAEPWRKLIAAGKAYDAHYREPTKTAQRQMLASR